MSKEKLFFKECTVKGFELSICCVLSILEGKIDESCTISVKYDYDYEMPDNICIVDFVLDFLQNIEDRVLSARAKQVEEDLNFIIKHHANRAIL